MNLQQIIRRKSLITSLVTGFIIFMCSLLFHQVTTNVYINNSTIKFDSSRLYIDLIRFSKDTMHSHISSVTTIFSIDSINHKGALYLVIKGFDENGNRIFECANDALISVASSNMSQNSIRQVMLIDSINSKINSCLVFLYNKGGNSGQVSNIKIEVQ